MKAVLISIRPEWCEKILSGQKTIEIRKTRPKLDTPFKVYIYCTKNRKYFFHNGIGETLDDLYRLPDGQIKFGYSGELMCCGKPYRPENFLNGKVIAEFTCDTIITVDCDSYAPFDKETEKYIDHASCVSREMLWKYTNGFCALGWHIADLKIYDKPKELSDFTGLKQTRFGGMPYKLQRPPQSWCYVEEI